MATQAQLMGLGLPGAVATALATGPITTITPAGASQAAATQINSPSVILGTASAAGVVLPPSNGAPETTIFNNSGNAQNVYPAPGETINALTANTSVSLASTKCGSFLPGDKGWLYSAGA